MTNKVREFRKPVNGLAKSPIKEPRVVFSFAGRRFAIEWIVTELNRHPAEVIPIRNRRKRNKRPRSPRT
jgi:hypothetical protein